MVGWLVGWLVGLGWVGLGWLVGWLVDWVVCLDLLVGILISCDFCLVSSLVYY